MPSTLSLSLQCCTIFLGERFSVTPICHRRTSISHRVMSSSFRWPFIFSCTRYTLGRIEIKKRDSRTFPKNRRNDSGFLRVGNSENGESEGGTGCGQVSYVTCWRLGFLWKSWKVNWKCNLILPSLTPNKFPNYFLERKPNMFYLNIS